MIVLDQAPKLLGVHYDKEGFFRDLVSFARHLPETSSATLAIAAATFAALLALERLRPHSPAPMLVVVGAIAASWLLGLQAMGVATVGLIPRGLPSLSLPDATLVAELAPAALASCTTTALGRRIVRCRPARRPRGCQTVSGVTIINY